MRGRLTLVRKERLELSRVAPLEPKSSASTSSATFARSAAIPAAHRPLGPVRRLLLQLQAETIIPGERGNPEFWGGKASKPVPEGANSALLTQIDMRANRVCYKERGQEDRGKRLGGPCRARRTAASGWPGREATASSGGAGMHPLDNAPGMVSRPRLREMLGGPGGASRMRRAPSQGWRGWSRYQGWLED
jgi:hypothetical protein